MNKEKLLEQRNAQKKKKPKFRGQNKLMVRIKEKWSQPKGQQSKLRKKRRGKVKQPSMGFSSPKAVRGTHKSGLMPVRVFNVKDLEKINVKEEGIIISKNVGMRKRVDIIKKAEEKKIKILNIKEGKKYIEKVKATMEDRKKRRAEIRLRHASKKKDDKKKDKKDDKKVEDKKDVPKDETKKGQKSEKIKMLEKKQ